MDFLRCLRWEDSLDRGLEDQCRVVEDVGRVEHGLLEGCHGRLHPLLNSMPSFDGMTSQACWADTKEASEEWAIVEM